MKLFSHHTLAVSAAIMLAVLLGSNTPSTLPTTSYQTEETYSIADAAKLLDGTKILFGSKFRMTGQNNETVSKVSARDCFPNYSKSTVVNDVYCLSRIRVGSVIYSDNAYRVSDSDHCSFLIGRQVKQALKSNIYQMCRNGDLSI